jgi:hypothetical protein
MVNETDLPDEEELARRNDEDFELYQYQQQGN